MEKTRPLSPHLSIYRWKISMVLSILHRITGVGLGIGTLLICYWFISIASGQKSFNTAQWFFDSIIGKLLLLGFTIALVFHLLNGVRHLFWDMGLGFELSTSQKSGWAVVILTFVFTLLIWILAYSVKVTYE
ncbi:MAG: succinate dehydrogenase, cytochrome b556 subunit [Rhodospirillaceae bacterium]|nr:succinate dehydrogenase, cytochrome b556 subunit [Rhodospirillaceae bacterium]